MKELLKRLDSALDDFTGNKLRAWPLSDLTAEQRQWIRAAEKQCHYEQEDERQAQPDFALFLQGQEKAGKDIWLGETPNR
ncbi:hypothetical protein, partial [Pseudomonas aeruginosa]|uniref:hypothetical protein n=1 Tax=Pseudomonas aeruginosa TaxID=287 RepID=UPI001F4AC8E0